MKEITEAVYQEVYSEYTNAIRLPKEKPIVQYLLCPIGLVGAGKTTVVTPLSEKLSLARVSNDEIRKLFHDRGYGYERVRDVAFAIITGLVKQGYSVCVDSDCASKVDFIKEEAVELNLKVVWIHINPPEEFIIHKLSHLEPNWLGTGEEMVANYFERKPLHKHFDLDFTYTFDTSRADLEKQIEESVPVIKHTVGLE